MTFALSWLLHRIGVLLRSIGFIFENSRNAIAGGTVGGVISPFAQMYGQMRGMKDDIARRGLLPKDSMVLLCRQSASYRVAAWLSAAVLIIYVSYTTLLDARILGFSPLELWIGERICTWPVYRPLGCPWEITPLVLTHFYGLSTAILIATVAAAGFFVTLLKGFRLTDVPLFNVQIAPGIIALALLLILLGSWAYFEPGVFRGTRRLGPRFHNVHIHVLWFSAMWVWLLFPSVAVLMRKRGEKNTDSTVS